MLPENEQVVQRFIEELWNSGDLDAADVLIAPAHVHHLGGEDYHGPEGVKVLVTWLRSVFPDLRFTVDDIVGDEGRVVIRWTASGTHLGDGFGMAPTGRHVEWTGTDWFRLTDDRICEVWAIVDGGTLRDRLTSTDTDE